MRGKAIFLDRDGVINRSVVRDGRPFPPKDEDEFEWMEGIHETLRELSARGYILLVFTNQPDVARGKQTLAQLERFDQLLLAELPIMRIYTCVHDDDDGCECRKPKPGMLFAGRADFKLDLGQCWVVGDRWRDIEAGKAAGCRTVLVQHGYSERRAAADYEIQRLPELLKVIP